ncbi:uncharacterized protein A4U43_C04F23460 [Asparagus officinalis]|uniref:Protein kinase domain-containing protein n=1 Tax=Asparagus officinalis TaxID=4686 RepID=A0A5P1F7V6_ASPOF|nr:uncharacterized protein A4U43_C04F23460 [Asparagus officinalis]
MLTGGASSSCAMDFSLRSSRPRLPFHLFGTGPHAFVISAAYHKCWRFFSVEWNAPKPRHLSLLKGALQRGLVSGAVSPILIFMLCDDLPDCIQSTNEADFFTEYGEASRYQIHEVVGKGSYGVVDAAVDTHNGEKVTIKKINDVFEHVSDATRILREIKLLGLLRHPDIVEIRHIMLPPSRREFKDIYVVFKLMESNLNQVIKANDDLTPEHHQFFMYQLLRAMKYIHSYEVYPHW